MIRSHASGECLTLSDAVEFADERIRFVGVADCMSTPAQGFARKGDDDGFFSICVKVVTNPLNYFTACLQDVTESFYKGRYTSFQIRRERPPPGSRIVGASNKLQDPESARDWELVPLEAGCFRGRGEAYVGDATTTSAGMCR